MSDFLAASGLSRRVLRLVLAATYATATVMACSSTTTTSVPNDDASTTPPGTDPDGGTPDEDAADSATAAPFKLLSTALTEGASFKADNTCTGTNVSPPFTWGAGPAATKSYAIVLTDKTNGLTHAIIYDIPADVLSLAADYPSAYAPAKPAGAHESKNYKGQFGYAGPCPPEEHTYEFALYAVDAAPLPAVTMASTTAVIVAALKSHMVAVTTLTGKYAQP